MIHIWFWDKVFVLRTAQHDSYSVPYFKKTRKNRTAATKADGTNTLEAVLVPISAVEPPGYRSKGMLTAAVLMEGLLLENKQAQLFLLLVHGNWVNINFLKSCIGF